MAATVSEEDHWRLQGGTVTKQLRLSGLTGAGTQHDMSIEIETSRSRKTGLLEPKLKIILTPDPLPALQKTAMKGQLRVPSTPFDPAPVPVVLTRGNGPSLEISTSSVQDAENFVQTISSGEQLVFALLDGDNRLIELPITNDLSVMKVLRQALD